MASLIKIVTVSLLSALVAAQSTFSPARPPAIPLAVRSPYLTTWQQAGSDGGNGGYLAGQWPTFWNGEITGWTGLIRVDNVTYTWLGDPAPLPTVVNQTAFSYTSTRSIFTMNVDGKIGMNITFLSPVTPTDMLRQSVPVSYMNVAVYSIDGNQHDVQLYSDVSAEWTSGNRSQIAQWNYGIDNETGTAPTKRSSETQVKRRDGWLNGAYGNKGELWPNPSSGRFSWDADAPWHSRGVPSELPEDWPYYSPPSPSVNPYSAPSGSAEVAPSTSSSGADSPISSSLSIAPTSSGSGSTESSASVDPVAGSTSSAPTSSYSSSTNDGTTVGTTATSSATSSVSVSATGNATTSVAGNSTATSTGSGSPTGTASAGGIAYHKFWRQLQQEFSEDSDQAAWGYWYYATENVAGLTHQSAEDIIIRAQFEDNGYLTDTEDTNYRAINDSYPVFGFAIDLGSVGSDSVDSLFTINLAQENAIQFDNGITNETIPIYWTSSFSDELSFLAFGYNDYSTVSGLATDLDNQVATDSVAKGGDNYLTITSLAVRQAWGALEMTGNATTQYLFLKEISSDGNIQTVDVLFPFWPILSYMNPAWGKLMLDPLFINQEAGQWPYMFSIHDLGDAFPNATGHSNGVDEMQPLEECGNMLIMTLDYAQKAQDTAYLNLHYNILNQWTQYLIAEAEYPQNQISTDDFAGALANQTNLAIKGIIGIEAMAVIANLTNHTADGANYTNIAHTYIDVWQTPGLGISTDGNHSTLNYNNDSTYSLLYNLYADQLLQTDLVPVSVYEMQSNWYPTVANKYGVPLDTRHTYTKNDWQLFCAAIAAPSTMSLFIDDIATWIDQTPTNHPVTDLYDTITGDYPDGIFFENRPVVGGWFSLLALAKTGIPGNSTSS